MKRWRRSFLVPLGALLVMVLGMAPAVLAQTVRGTVTDSATSRPLEGATVTLSAGSRRVLTGADGTYQFASVPAGSIIVRVQMIGYAPASRTITMIAGQDATIDFGLPIKPVELEEMVSIGYGQVKRDNLSTAVSTVSSEDITGQANASADASLAGKAPGVQVTQNAGNPGNGISVRVRGSASITAGNQPLYVVDGVPMISEDLSQLGLGGQGIRAITGLSSEDIATIDVLKDAAAASIYGSRASNGVVLITTKRGRAGESAVTFNAYYGTQAVTRKLNLLTGPEYLDYMRESAVNDGYDPDDYFPATGNNVDWQDLVLRNAPISGAEIAASGGNDKVRYRVSGNWFDQEGIVISSGYRRIGGRANLDFQINPKLSVTTNISVTGEKNDRVEADDNLEGIVGNAMAEKPYISARRADGSFRPKGEDVPTNLTYVNALDLAAHNTTQALTNTVLANVETRYDLGGGLMVTGRVGVDFYNLTETQYQSPLVAGSSGATFGGVAKRGYSNGHRYVFDGFVNYDKTFNEKHVLSLTGGASLEKSTTDNNFVRAENLIDSKVHEVSGGTTAPEFSGVWGENNLVSFFGRANYTMSDKYLLGLSFRRDGASVFGPDNRQGFFPGASLAWVMNRENFLADNKTITQLKLRGSWGRTGNQSLSDYPYQGTYCSANYGDNPGYYPCTLANEALGWEKTTQVDLGFDLELWNGRVGLSADWYNKKTTDLLLSRPVAGSTGYTEFIDNIGAVSNKGTELALTVVPIQPTRADGFRLAATLNLSTNRNRVTKLYKDQPFLTGSYDINRVEVGQRLGAFYTYHFVGVDPATGDAIYEDLNGDGEITTDDKRIVGDPWPDFTGGFTLNSTFKRFDVNAFFQFSKGNEVFNAVRVFADDGGCNYDNKYDNVLKRWQQPGDITREPRASFDCLNQGGPDGISDRMIEDASYLRLADLTVGYTLPENFASKLGLTTARFYIRGQNVFTSTDYTGYNPEVNSNGESTTALATDFYAYPVARTWSFGFQAGW